MARIAVLIGVYNCASTLVEALDSLYAQTYQDFKVILCDDGSTDLTYGVAKQYADNHDNIILIRNENNKGLNYTLNRCLDYADTAYCARMDGDDISLPTRFEQEIRFLDEHPEFALVSCPMIHFDENGCFRTGEAIEYPQKKDFVHGSPFCHAAAMIRTNVLKEVGGYTVDDRLLRVEDYHLWMKIYAAGYKGYNLQMPLYKMRDDRQALMRRTWLGRKNEMYVRNLGVEMLDLPWYTRVYALRPLLAYLAPRRIYNLIHKWVLSK